MVKGIQKIFELEGRAYIGILEYQQEPGHTFLWLGKAYASKQGKNISIVIPTVNKYIALPGKRYKKSLIKAFLENNPKTKVHNFEGKQLIEVYKLIKRLNG